MKFKIQRNVTPQNWIPNLKKGDKYIKSSISPIKKNKKPITITGKINPDALGSIRLRNPNLQHKINVKIKLTKIDIPPVLTTGFERTMLLKFGTSKIFLAEKYFLRIGVNEKVIK